MKNRRTIIVAFLVVAMLVVGVGYAAIEGNLSISGYAEFNGADTVTNEVLKAVKFTDATVNETDVGVVANASVTGDHAADITLTISDGIGDPNGSFSATAVYTVTYSSDDLSMPSVLLEVNTPTLPDESGHWSITTNWDSTNGDTLAPGESTTLTVTVTFAHNGNVEKGTVSGNLGVGIKFSTITPTNS